MPAHEHPTLPADRCERSPGAATTGQPIIATLCSIEQITEITGSRGWPDERMDMTEPQWWRRMTDATRSSARVFLRDVGHGLLEVSHNMLALLGLLVVAAALFEPWAAQMCARALSARHWVGCRSATVPAARTWAWPACRTTPRHSVSPAPWPPTRPLAQPPAGGGRELAGSPLPGGPGTGGAPRTGKLAGGPASRVGTYPDSCHHGH